MTFLAIDWKCSKNKYNEENIFSRAPTSLRKQIENVSDLGILFACFSFNTQQKKH